MSPLQNLVIFNVKTGRRFKIKKGVLPKPTTVGELKIRIGNHTGIPPEKLILDHEGTTLLDDDSTLLSDVDTGRKSRIHFHTKIDSTEPKLVTVTMEHYCQTLSLVVPSNETGMYIKDKMEEEFGIFQSRQVISTLNTEIEDDAQLHEYLLDGFPQVFRLWGKGDPNASPSP